MRPRGEINRIIEACIAHLGEATFDDIAQQSKIGRAVACKTLCNMLRCGRVEVVGHRKQIEGKKGNRPMNVYRLAAQISPPNGVDELQHVMYRFGEVRAP